MACDHPSRRSPRRPPARRSKRPRTPGTPAIRSGWRAPTPRTRNGATATSSSAAAPAIVEFLRRKWERELDYALRKDLWAFTDNRIAVRFQYESRDASGQWWRSYGNEQWEFDAEGYMRRREASINDVADRRDRSPHRRPASRGGARLAAAAGLSTSDTEQTGRRRRLADMTMSRASPPR